MLGIFNFPANQMSFFNNTSIDTKATTVTCTIFVALFTRMAFALETFQNPKGLIGRACTICSVGDVAAAVTFAAALFQMNLTGYQYRKSWEG
jgi:hypothetical protein